MSVIRKKEGESFVARRGSMVEAALNSGGQLVHVEKAPVLSEVNRNSGGYLRDFRDLLPRSGKSTKIPQ